MSREQLGRSKGWHIAELKQATALNDMAQLHCVQGDYQKAEDAYRKMAQILAESLGPSAPELIVCIHNLGLVLRAQEKNEDAAVQYTRALLLAEQVYGSDDLRTAARLNYLAGAYNAQGKYALAETIVRRSLDIYESKLGGEHHFVALALLAMAILCRRQSKADEANQYFERCAAINDRNRSPGGPSIAESLSRLAQLLYTQG